MEWNRGEESNTPPLKQSEEVSIGHSMCDNQQSCIATGYVPIMTMESSPHPIKNLVWTRCG